MESCAILSSCFKSCQLNNQPIFPCCLCPYNCLRLSLDELETHIAASHLYWNPYECFSCQKQMPSERAMRYHMAVEHPTLPLKIIYEPDDRQSGLLTFELEKSCSLLLREWKMESTLHAAHIVQQRIGEAQKKFVGTNASELAAVSGNRPITSTTCNYSNSKGVPPQTDFLEIGSSRNMSSHQQEIINQFPAAQLLDINGSISLREIVEQPESADVFTPGNNSGAVVVGSGEDTTGLFEVEDSKQPLEDFQVKNEEIILMEDDDNDADNNSTAGRLNYSCSVCGSELSLTEYLKHDIVQCSKVSFLSYVTQLEKSINRRDIIDFCLDWARASQQKRDMNNISVYN